MESAANQRGYKVFKAICIILCTAILLTGIWLPVLEPFKLETIIAAWLIFALPDFGALLKFAAKREKMTRIQVLNLIFFFLVITAVSCIDSMA
ncbi:MAG TPA: hypothetical protein VHP31_11535 [Caproicibacter sp.]|nr:hypothetical protein [Caproicibacter sp.]